MRAISSEKLTIGATAVSPAAATLNPTGQQDVQQLIGILEDADVRYLFDGTTPTASLGLPLLAGQAFILEGAENLKQLSFIAQSGTAVLNLIGLDEAMPPGKVLQGAAFQGAFPAGGQVALADGKILVGSAAGVGAAVALSGDATIDNAGEMTIAALAITAGKLAAAVTAMINGLRTYLADGLLTIGTLAISGVAAEKFKTTTTTNYTIGGIAYVKAATDNLVFSAADTINVGAAVGDFWGGWIVQIDAAGTVTTKSVGADQVYASEAAAIAALPAVDAGNVQVGYITVQANSDVAWTANTDDMTPASDCQAANFYDLPGAKALPAAL